MKKIICSLLVLFAMTVFGFRIQQKIVFNQNVKGYLKHAADANTVELAYAELTKAIDYLEANNLTNGYTSVFYKTPDDDIGFWYKNLKASQKELTALNSNSTLEKTNVLIKLRETLLDVGEKTKVTVPDDIYVYPNNKMWAFLTTAAFFSLFGFVGFIPTESSASKNS